MTVLKKLNEQMKQAMKDKNSKRLSVIRMLITEIKTEEKLKGQKRTEDEICLAYHKKLVKSLDFFPEDKKLEIKDEIKIVEEFMPKMMTKEEIVSFIKDNIPKDQVSMKTVMPALKGKADSQLVKQVVDGWKTT